MTTIYTLSDPRTQQARYVGKTTQSLAARLDGHLRDRTSSHRTNWIKSLCAAGLKPSISAVAIVEDHIGCHTERCLIALIGRSRLVNGTDGGEGLLNPGPETRRLISVSKLGNKHFLGRRHTEESKARMSASNIGKQSRLGHTNSADHRRRISEAKKEYWRTHKFSDDALRRIGESSKGRQTFLGRRHSEESKRLMSESAKKRQES